MAIKVVVPGGERFEMFIHSCGSPAATDAVAQAALGLSGLEPCGITVMHPPGLDRMVCSLAGFGEGAVRVRTSHRLSRESLVQIGIGHAMIIFGTVRGVTKADAESGFEHEVAITSAFVQQPTAA